MNTLTQPIRKVITNLSLMYPTAGQTIEQLAMTCYTLGQLDQMKEQRVRLEQAFNTTMPDGAEPWNDQKPEVEVL